MINKEIERKFLINTKNIPYDLNKLNYEDITQCYITSNDNSLTFRLRQVLYVSPDKETLGDDYFQTFKGEGTKIRDEYETRLLRGQFSKMWKACNESESGVHKHRFFLPKHEINLIYHLDEYKNELEGLYTIEVEFNTLEECDAYVPEKWFGLEVTEDLRYKNLSLAKDGLPKK